MEQKIKGIAFPMVVATAMCMCCIYASSISVAVKSSIGVCLNSIVPSMYAFMIVSNLLVYSNCHRAIGRALSPIARYLFHMDGELFAVLLVSMVAGYPVGAKLISSLERQHSIGSTTAKDMYCYCYSGGLAFILGTISGGLRVALMVYISNVVANLLLAMLLSRKSAIPKKDSKPIAVNLSSKILIYSIDSAFRVMVTVCTMIVAFSIAICLLDTLHISGAVEVLFYRAFGTSKEVTHSVVSAVLEVSNLMHLKVLGVYYLPTVSALFSFGGVCVVLQILTISGSSFNLKHFLQCRLFTSGVSFVVCYVSSRLLLSNWVAVGYVYQSKVTESSSIVPSICLLCMSFILLSSSRNFKSNSL